MFKNIPLDNIIEEYIQTKDPQNLFKFRERKRALRELKEGRKVRRVRVKIHIDIRDDNYVWRVGVILKVINRNEKNILLLVQLKYSKETILIGHGDERIAMIGSYTNHP